MKIYQIIFFTISTVSFIHCSQQPSQNEDNNSAYHIEFEDKSAQGGYGYKVQVAGKTKYQETWKNDKQNVQTESSTEPLDYLPNSYSGGTENVKAVDNNVADNYLSSSAAHTSSITPKQNVQYVYQQPISDASSYQTEQITQSPYSTSSSYNSYSQQIYKPDLVPQSSYSPQIQDSSNQDWQISTKSAFVPSVPLPSKPSLQIMDYNHYGASNGPQIFVESTSGKLNQNQFASQFDAKPQITLPTEADLTNHYLQNANLYQNSFKPSTSHSQYVTPLSVGYYQPSSQKGTNNYKTSYTSYPSLSPIQISKHVPQLGTDVNNYQVKQLYTSPVTQYANDVITQNPRSKLQYYTPSLTKPVTYLSEQNIKHSKGNVIHKTKATTVKYAPQYQESVQYSQNPVYSQYIPHSSPIPSTNLDYSHGTIHQNIPTLSSSYPNDLSQNVKYVDQNSHPINADYSQLFQQYPAQSIQLQSVSIPEAQNTQQYSGIQIKQSPQVSNDYQIVQMQVPTEYQSASIKSSPKNTQYQNIYSVQQPTVNYQYKQELSYPKIQPSSQNSQNVQPSLHIPVSSINPNSYKIQPSKNNVPASQSSNIPLNPINHSDLTNSFSNLLGGYNQQAVSNPGIPISQYGVKDNSQLLYAPGMIYGQGANGQSLLNLNAFSSSLGHQGLQVMSPYNIMRRSSAKHNKNVDQKQTE